MQGMLELVELPYVGSGVLGAPRSGMDKHFMKIVLQAAGHAGRAVGHGHAGAMGAAIPRACAADARDLG